VTSVSVITGGAGAMGSACADALASAVDAILLTDRDETGLDAAAARVERATGAAVITVVGDVADPTVLKELATRVAALGTMHSLVHAAGVSPSMADWREVLRVDLTGTAQLLDAFLEHAVAGSAAVCVASIAGHMGSFDPEMDAVLDAPLTADFAERFRSQFGGEPDPGSTYRLAKRGVIRLCERAAIAWGRRGGRVVSLSPGLMDTAMGRLELINQPIKQQMVERTPIRSTRQLADAALPGHTTDIADAVAFLCSERASFISGCDLRVDGGFVAAMNHPAE
jgi:NAD(P)-dependent dehydrogenase (short-subunit alcohol dehydrogenase family)